MQKGSTDNLVLTLFLEASWLDPRLKFKNFIDDEAVAVDSEISTKIWHPMITLEEGMPCLRDNLITDLIDIDFN